MSLTVRRRCADVATARALCAAVAADTPPYVSLAVEGSELVVRLVSRSAASARTTLEDLLACLSAAERSRPSDRGRGPPDPGASTDRAGYERRPK